MYRSTVVEDRYKKKTLANWDTSYTRLGDPVPMCGYDVWLWTL